MRTCRQKGEEAGKVLSFSPHPPRSAAATYTPTKIVVRDNNFRLLVKRGSFVHWRMKMIIHFTFHLEK